MGSFSIDSNPTPQIFIILILKNLNRNPFHYSTLAMFFSYFLFFLFSIFTTHTVSTSLPSSTLSLLQFQQSLSESSQLLLPWNQSHQLPSPCQWTGISCYPNSDFKDFQVKSLNLSGLGLSGNLINSITHLCNLKGLLSLDLSGNKFTGFIPPLIQNLSQLETLLLNDNNLEGPIPPEVFLSKQLQKLDLGYNFLTGRIPHEVSLCVGLEYLGLNNNFLCGEISFLPNVKFLYLNSNNFTGSLPDFLPSCGIIDLWVHENMFSGSLPFSLGNCFNLTTFFASQNGFGGIIPPEIFEGLSQLEVLYLDGNEFIGEMPVTLWGLSNLQELVLSGNKLNGSIPGEINGCKRLTAISLSDNRLVGRIPRSIGSLRDLNILVLSDNMLGGSLPHELGNCSSLVELNVQNNFIEGTLPKQIFKLENLEVLYLFNNRFQGEIPPEIGKLSKLAQLALYNNSLSGWIPTEITHLRNLRFLSLAYNNLTGEIPSELGKNTFPGLIKLDLTGNGLYGSIPSGLCNANNLSVLVLGNNLLNGSFPFEIGKCASLRRVILKNNLLRGSIPEDLDRNLGISFLDLQGNFFTGKIPPVLGFWSNLSMLDISNNCLSGSIPPQLGNLKNLQILRISSNRLTGSIPPELGNCMKMIKLDLSKNRFSGSIPSKIANSLKLQSLLLQENELNGTIPDKFSSVQSLFELQFGDNMLEGQIPCSLGNLRHFSFALNLSKNMLMGKIPPCLGNLDKLQVLDLSSNNLSGEIPFELNNMISLSFVNLSFNQLSGKPPRGWMELISSSSMSFLGNSKLCILGNKGGNCGEGVKKYHKRTRGEMVATVTICIIFSVSGICGIIYLLVVRGVRRRWANFQALIHDARSTTEDLPKDLKYEDIMRATEGLNEKYIIGRGRHGTVYRTESVNSRKLWAVKKLDLSEVSFNLEMKTLSMVRHRNLVRMAGYCIKDGFGLIVTEYMPCGTLFDILHRNRSDVVLDWNVRHRIALGIAQGLSYLHHDCVPQIIHRDIKSDNILMDSEMEPRIGDFGMSKLVNDSDSSFTRSSIVGTLGYIAPENGYSTRLTEKCDVYSYGVILLELLCRKMPVDPSFEDGLDIVSWMRKNLQKAEQCPLFFIDEEISFWMEDEKSKALELLNLALSCTELASDARPSMRETVRSLMKLKKTVLNRGNSSFSEHWD
ncbi:Protein kinase domain [Macleaya cordata]|uniref:non-specific serine/threonine protein kinase n=1 Tax=Macleaya cordata TaxID=56857 RepID=A0A200Q2R8_MACCD|nr:Protein kinase domain [Macleaya cordata]